MSIPEHIQLHKGQGGRNGLDEAYKATYISSEHLEEDAERPRTLPGKLFGDWVLVACAVLLGTLCFGLGTLAAKQNGHSSSDKLWIEQLPASELPGSVGTSSVSVNLTGSEQPQALPAAQVSSASTHTAQNLAAAAAAAPTSAKNYVASKTGTKYYLPSCGTAKRIKENKVYFATKAQAESAGYKPASNCKGL